MNAPAKVAPSRDRYIPIVKHHLPACEGKELELRCSILFLRDKAAAAMRRCSEEAEGVLCEVQRIASTYAYANIPTESLGDVRYQLLRLTMAASGLEMFAYRLAHPEGTDAGG
jgi:hypothetical protein